MNSRDDFRVSSNATEKQKQDYEQERRKQAERKRLADIDRIKNEAEQRNARTMLNHRDDAVKKARDQADAKLERMVDEEFRKRGGHKAELHIKPPRGMSGPTPQQREAHTRTQIRQNLGKSLDLDGREIEREWNQKIDKFVANERKNEQVKSRSAGHEETAKTEPEKEKPRRPWESDHGRDGNDRGSSRPWESDLSKGRDRG